MIVTRTLFWLCSFVLCSSATDFVKDVFQPRPVHDTEGVNSNFRYCFQFTWIGSKYDKESQIKNLTCDDLLKGGKGVPCLKPLVATTNGNQLPDTDWMWEKYKRKVACRMTDGDVCVKFSYIYNRAVENITYMCGKVRIDGENAVNDGCYSTYRDGKEIEVCACESEAGRIPCNSGNITHKNFVSFIIFMFLLSIAMLTSCLW